MNSNKITLSIDLLKLVGGATIHGWTWIGFATEDMMTRFSERWQNIQH